MARLRIMVCVVPGGTSFANKDDYAVCRRLHREYGTTYFLASRTFPQPIRRHTDAVYAFVRVPDEWVDNPEGLSSDEVLHKLKDYRRQMAAGLQGQRPEHPAMRAFVDVITETGIPIEEPSMFLDAMEADLTKSRYQTFRELCDYMRGSAATVALMMCQVTGKKPEFEIKERAIAMANAMQLTNFLRDIAEDAKRGRIYVPLEDLNQFGVKESDFMEPNFTDSFRELMKFEIQRTRELYDWGEAGIHLLPPRTQRAVRIARILYSKILDRLEEQDCNPFLGRARTSHWEKVKVISQCLLSKPQSHPEAR